MDLYPGPLPWALQVLGWWHDQCVTFPGPPSAMWLEKDGRPPRVIYSSTAVYRKSEAKATLLDKMGWIWAHSGGLLWPFFQQLLIHQVLLHYLPQQTQIWTYTVPSPVGRALGFPTQLSLDIPPWEMFSCRTIFTPLHARDVACKVWDKHLLGSSYLHPWIHLGTSQ